MKFKELMMHIGAVESSFRTPFSVKTFNPIYEIKTDDATILMCEINFFTGECYHHTSAFYVFVDFNGKYECWTKMSFEYLENVGRQGIIDTVVTPNIKTQPN